MFSGTSHHPPDTQHATNGGGQGGPAAGPDDQGQGGPDDLGTCGPDDQFELMGSKSK